MKMRRALLLLLPLLVGGCGLFSHTPSRFYSLDPVRPASVTEIRGLPIGLDVVELPPGMDRKEVVVRKAGHELEIRGTDQWTATLQPLILHTLGADLASRMPENMSILPGQAKPVAPMRSLDIMIEELAPGPDRAVTMDVRWTLRTPGMADFSRREHIVAEIGSLDSVNVAGGLSSALGTLADRIVAELPKQ